MEPNRIMPNVRHAIALIHPLVRTITPSLRGAVLDRIFFSPEHKFIYFRIPKSANSTIVLSLAKAMGAQDLDARGSVPKQSTKKNLKLRLCFSSLVEQCYTFTFVRDPFSRILSAYLDKIATENPKFLGDLKLGNRKISFLEFLKRLDDGYLTTNIHWAPQSDIIPLHPAKLNFVGRVEHLNADLPEVMNRIFGTGDHQVVQRAHGVTSASSRLAEFYGHQERQLLIKLYARDFELFYSHSV